LVNHIFSFIEKDFPDAAQKFLEKLSIQKEKYHGGTFKVNSSRLILKRMDILQSIIPLGGLKYVELLRSFDKVVKSCFSHELDPQFEPFSEEHF
jgi:hypothetical protein